MKHLFTPKKMRPSAKTIYFIKQMAYTYLRIQARMGILQGVFHQLIATYNQK